MKINSIVISGLLLAIAVLLAGCTGTQNEVAQPVQPQTTVSTPAPVVTAEPTVEVTEVTPEPVDPIWNEPVSQPPDDLSISTTVQKDQIYDTIIASFNGGLGQSLVSDIQVRVITSDGRDEIQHLAPDVGATVSFVGTTENDEVMVAVWYMNGNSYKISDEVLGFQPTGV